MLHDPKAPAFKPFVVAGRERLATCSSISWFQGYHLAVVNLYGSHLRVYRFHPEETAGGRPPWLELLHELTEGISFPEDVAVSPDGTQLAVSHSMCPSRGVTLHSIDPVSLAPSPILTTLRAGVAFHGVKYSPDSRHLAFTEVGTPGFVEVVRVSPRSLERTCLLENRQAPLKPKSISFSHDGRFAFIVVGPGATPSFQAHHAGGRLSVHRFDMAKGVIAMESVAELCSADKNMAYVEMCAVLPNAPGEPYRILLTNQASDSVLACQFSGQDLSLSLVGTVASGLSFPHGLDVSHDGRYLAIANYGDDSLRIARMAPISAGVPTRL